MAQNNIVDVLLTQLRQGDRYSILQYIPPHENRRSDNFLLRLRLYALYVYMCRAAGVFRVNTWYQFFIIFCNIIYEAAFMYPNIPTKIRCQVRASFGEVVEALNFLSNNNNRYSHDRRRGTMHRKYRGGGCYYCSTEQASSEWEASIRNP